MSPSSPTAASFSVVVDHRARRSPAPACPSSPAGSRRRGSCRRAACSRSARSRRGSSGRTPRSNARITSGLSGSPAETMCRTRERSYALEPVELRHQPVLGRRLAEHRRAELADQPEALLRVERALVEHGRRARLHGPSRTFQIDFAQPVPAVHQTTSSGFASSQRSACARFAQRVAVRVHDALRILRRPGGVEDERRILGAGVGGLGDRLAELGLARVDDLGRLGHRLDLARASRGRRRAARAPEWRTRKSRSLARSISEQGIATAPTFSPASITENQSGVLPIRTSTRSPGATPRSRSRPAQRAASVGHLAEA